MYLEHFGLNEPPFKITPVTEFFFSGANRGEILDALIYAIINSEGIIKITGEVGSGKTMLCRMLLDRLPSNVKAIYLANPSLTRDELIYAIADPLDLDLEGQRINVLMQNLQNDLVTKYSQGIRCVVLVDEAHAMPLDTLEELRLLYNLQVGKHKLIQIVLFGQPELDDKLQQDNMRQLKDRILHNFNILPLSPKVIDSYLMFRMRAAGYKGPDIFSAAAVRLIGQASHGLMRRVNILADKSLLSAFVENTHNIEVRHVQAAIRDSELASRRISANSKRLAVTGVLAAFAGILIGIGVFTGYTNSDSSSGVPIPSKEINQATIAAPEPVSAVLAVSAVATAVNVASTSGVSVISSPAPIHEAETADKSKSASTIHAAKAEKATPDKAESILSLEKSTNPAPLLKQRLQATRKAIKSNKGGIGVQLFYTNDVRPEHMEQFLVRAKKLDILKDIYILPISINGNEGYRVLCGIYPDSESASAGIEKLPKRYKEAFAPALYIIPSMNTP